MTEFIGHQALVKARITAAWFQSAYTRLIYNIALMKDVVTWDIFRSSATWKLMMAAGLWLRAYMSPILLRNVPLMIAGLVMYQTLKATKVNIIKYLLTTVLQVFILKIFQDNIHSCSYDIVPHVTPRAFGNHVWMSWRNMQYRDSTSPARPKT